MYSDYQTPMPGGVPLLRRSVVDCRDIIWWTRQKIVSALLLLLLALCHSFVETGGQSKPCNSFAVLFVYIRSVGVGGLATTDEVADKNQVIQMHIYIVNHDGSQTAIHWQILEIHLKMLEANM